MAETWNVLVPKQIDPSGPDAIADFAACTGMDEYDSVDAALDELETRMRDGEQLVLVCFEGDRKRCHRTLLRERLQNRLDGA